MDFGALIQSFTSESILPAGNGMANKAGFNSLGRSSGDLSADNETTSFIQAVQQILGQADSKQTAGSECSESDQSDLESSNGLSQMMLLLEILVQKDMADLESIPPLENDSGAEIDIADLLVQINSQLSEMDTAFQNLSGDNTDNQTGLLTLLNDLIPALETSTAGAKHVINDNTLNDLQKTRSLLQTAMEQIMGAGKEAVDADVLIENAVDLPEAEIPRAKISDKMADSMIQMGNNGVIDDSAGSVATGSATKKTESPLVAGMQSDQTDSLKEIKSDPSEQAKADTSGGNTNQAKSLVQALMAKKENPQVRQDDSQAVSVNDTDTSDSFERDGYQKTAKEIATVTEASQKAASPQNVLDQPLFGNDKSSLKNSLHPQSVENEPDKVAVSKMFDTEGVENDSLKAGVSVDAIIDNKAPQSVSIKSTSISMPASGDTTFQKTVMDQIVEKASFRSVNDRSEMRIQLKPDSLGEVRMNVVSEKNQLVVQMIAEKSETKEIIESQIHHLKAELDKQGLTIGKIEVTISANNDQQDSRGQFFQMFKNNSDGSGKRQDGSRQETASQHQQGDEKETDSSRDGINYFV